MRCWRVGDGQQDKTQEARELQKFRTASNRARQAWSSPEGSIITLGIVSCAFAIVLVVAVAIASAT